MEKNYYEWLEINENASPEIIEKAYKTLIKKYHPDLQKENNKKIKYQEIIKKINEAYEVLSDKNKKNKYDEFIKKNYFSKEDYLNLKNENIKLKNEINNLTNIINNKLNNNLNYYSEINTNKYTLNNNINKEKNINFSDNLNNKIKYKKTPKDYFKSFISLICVIIFWIILLQIPFIKNFLININNPIINTLMNLFNF